MPIDLTELKRQSKIAAVLTLISSFVVLASLLFGYVQTNRAEHRVAELQKTEERLKKETDDLERKREGLTKDINRTINADSTQTAQRPTPSVSGHPVQIFIDVVETRNPAEAQKAAEVLRSHGYVVKAIDVKRVGEAPHETTVRFFQYDRSTVAVGKDLVNILKGIGFTVRPEFDDEYVGDSSGPDPGTFEFWIGTNASYNPPPQSH